MQLSVKLVIISSHYPLYLHTYVSIRQHTSAYVSIRQHTSAYVCWNLISLPALPCNTIIQ